MNQKPETIWKFGSIPMIDPEHLGLVLATSSDIALLLNSDTKISSILVNNAEKSYGNLNHWIGRKITDFLTTESIPKIIAAIEKLESDETVLYGLELNHLDNAEWQFPIKYNIHRLGKDGQIILLGRDLQSVSENQQRFVKAQIAAEESIEEKNVPTNPTLWSRAKSLAKSKFDVYPSAYANGWAAKWYKSKGGGWKKA